METRFDVYLSGEVADGFTPEQVCEGLGRLFSIDAEAARRLVNGQRHRVKQQCDKATALQYREALLGIGALVAVERHTPANPAAGQQPPGETPDTPPSPSGEDPTREAVTDRTAPDLDIAPVGAIMSEGTAAAQPAPVDVPDYDLAPAGAPIPSVKVDRAPINPSTDHLQLTPIDDQ